MKLEQKTARAMVLATGEKIVVYRLKNGNYYDYNSIGEDKKPSAVNAGKKEFKKDELLIY